MIDFPGEHPEPPSDLATREPLLDEMPVGAILSRLHAKGKNPLSFGRTGGNRFDSPDFTYGVLYSGLDEYCSFIETYGQTTGIRTVTERALDGRHLAHLELLCPMKLIDLSNSGGLARIGADSRLFSGSHAVAQRWSAALRGHPANLTVSSIPLAMMRRETHARSMNVLLPFLNCMRRVRFLSTNTPRCSEQFLTVTDSHSFRNLMFRNNSC